MVHGLAWLAAATLISLGAGGIVQGADQPAGDRTRPELTARGDRLMAAPMAALGDDLDLLQADVDRLGETGRDALIALADRDVARLSSLLAEGDGVLDRIELLAARVQVGQTALPFGAASDRISIATRGRVIAVQRALENVAPLGDTWQRLARGSVPAMELISVLEHHDRQTAAAALDGTRERYDRALAQLTVSLADLDRASAIRDRLANGADVRTLDDWLRRSRAYDAALVRLYRLLRASGGTLTPQAREQYRRVIRLQQELPFDTRAMVVIVSDIARGGLNQAVIAVEQARARLAAAVAAVH